MLLGLIAFSVGTAGGVLFGKLMYIFTKGKVNPLIALPVCLPCQWPPASAKKRGREKTPPTSC